MKLGTLVTNDTLGIGIVVEIQEKNNVMVCWYEVKTSPSMIITKRANNKHWPIERWYAPSGFGRVLVMSE